MAARVLHLRFQARRLPTQVAAAVLLILEELPDQAGLAAAGLAV